MGALSRRANTVPGTSRDADLLKGAKAAVDGGFRAIKLKVGSAEIGMDLARIEAVRKAVGSQPLIAVDANAKWDLPTCKRFASAAAAYDIIWFEEPLWFDDFTGHGRLAESSPIPIALGESLYTVDAFRQLVEVGGIDYAQPDVTRVGGVTGYFRCRACATRMAFRSPVTPEK